MLFMYRFLLQNNLFEKALLTLDIFIKILPKIYSPFKLKLDNTLHAQSQEQRERGPMGAWSH